MINKSWSQDYKNRIEEEFKTKATVSTTNGISIYITYRGYKVRFSDHQTSTFSGRHLEEIHVTLNSKKEFIDRRIEKMNPENYKHKLAVKELVNTEFGVKKLFPNAFNIEILEERGLSKKTKQPLFLFAVSVNEEIYIGK